VLPQLESEQFRARLASSGVAHCALPLHRPERRLLGLALYLASFPLDILRLFFHFRSNGYDLVHCSGGAWQVKGVIAAWLSGIPIIWHLNDSSMPWYVRMSFRVLARVVDTFVVAGARVKQYYMGEFSIGKPIVEIQAPVDCSVFDPAKTVASEKLSKTKLNVVTVANVNPLKGIEYFIEMASKLERSVRESAEFYVVGPTYSSQSAYARSLGAMVEREQLGNLHFLGAASDIAGVLAATDVFVCSSVAEASPIAVWESMAMARAVVSTDVGDVARFLPDGVAGYVVPTRNSDELARAVSALAVQPGLRARLGRAARESALRHLDIKICVAKHLETYAGLAAAKPREGRSQS
jgi:glycosyltransferase involved in cell wall biosynthesis